MIHFSIIKWTLVFQTFRLVRYEFLQTISSRTFRIA